MSSVQIDQVQWLLGLGQTHRHAARQRRRGRGVLPLIDAAYERRSVAVTSNLHPAGFDTIMPKTIANATVDRLLHHAHVVITEGSSHRLAEATAGKGVIALTLTPPGRSADHTPGVDVAAYPEIRWPPTRTPADRRRSRWADSTGERNASSTVATWTSSKRTGRYTMAASIFPQSRASVERCDETGGARRSRVGG
jgi:hypothetical protein